MFITIDGQSIGYPLISTSPIPIPFPQAKVLSHVEKESFTTVVVQKATLEFLRLAGMFGKPEARQEVIEHARDALVHILHTHEGAKIALQALWHGTAKDRKAILKSFKGHVVKIAMDEHGYQVRIWKPPDETCDVWCFLIIIMLNCSLVMLPCIM